MYVCICIYKHIILKECLEDHPTMSVKKFYFLHELNSSQSSE